MKLKYRKGRKLFEKSTGKEIVILKIYEDQNRYFCNIGSQSKYLREDELREQNISVPKVTPVTSYKKNSIKNQYIIQTDKGKFFQSYDDVIVYVPSEPNERTVLDEKKWDCSDTTRRYREIFLKESHEETLKKIADNTYILDNLD